MTDRKLLDGGLDEAIRNELPPIKDTGTVLDKRRRLNILAMRLVEEIAAEYLGIWNYDGMVQLGQRWGDACAKLVEAMLSEVPSTD